MTRPKTLTGIFGRVSSKCVNVVYAGSPMYLQNSDIVKYIRILFSHLLIETLGSVIKNKFGINSELIFYYSHSIVALGLGDMS